MFYQDIAQHSLPFTKQERLETIQDLPRFGDTALKTSSDDSMTLVNAASSVVSNSQNVDGFLTVFPNWRTLFQESAHPFLLVFRVEQVEKHLTLQMQG